MLGVSVPSKEQLMHVIGRLGMKRFASVVMWVLWEVFAMPEVYMLCEANEREGIEKTKHNLRLVRHYPEEAICEPFFRVYHFLWRKLSLWRF